MLHNGSVYFGILRKVVLVDGYDDSIADIERQIIDGKADPGELYRYAKAHCIKPLLAKLAGRLDPGLLPDGLLEKTGSDYQKNLFDQLSYASEFYRVNKFLNEEGIVAVPFKGFWLAHEMYGNVGEREGGDIDLFVSESDLERIEAVMSGLGYEVERSFDPYTLTEIKKKFSEYNFDRIENGKCIFHFEFHWKAGLSSHGLDIALSDLESQIIRGMHQGTHIFTPSAHLVLAVMHHGGKDPLIKLKQISDIARIIHSGSILDWDWITTTAERFRIKDLVFISVKLASELTGVEIPAEIRAHTDKRKIKRLTENRIKYMSWQPERWKTLRFVCSDWLFRFRSRDGIRVKCTLFFYFVRKVLMPYLVPKRWHYLFLKRNRKGSFPVNERNSV